MYTVSDVMARSALKRRRLSAKKKGGEEGLAQKHSPWRGTAPTRFLPVVLRKRSKGGSDMFINTVGSVTVKGERRVGTH